MTSIDPAPPQARARLATPSVFLATWAGAGFLPGMPGTWASAAALPFAWVLVLLGGPWLLVAAAAALFAVGLWASARYMAITKVHDPGPVVIDEVVGQWLTLAFIPLNPWAYILGFFLFRVFDVLKPWPVGWVDRRVGGAFGVMIDDVLAAVYAGIALYLLVYWFWL